MTERDQGWAEAVLTPCGAGPPPPWPRLQALSPGSGNTEDALAPDSLHRHLQAHEMDTFASF